MKELTEYEKALRIKGQRDRDKSKKVLEMAWGRILKEKEKG